MSQGPANPSRCVVSAQCTGATGDGGAAEVACRAQQLLVDRRAYHPNGIRARGESHRFFGHSEARISQAIKAIGLPVIQKLAHSRRQPFQTAIPEKIQDWRDGGGLPHAFTQSLLPPARKKMEKTLKNAAGSRQFGARYQTFGRQQSMSSATVFTDVQAAFHSVLGEVCSAGFSKTPQGKRWSRTLRKQGDVPNIVNGVG